MTKERAKLYEVAVGRINAKNDVLQKKIQELTNEFNQSVKGICQDLNVSERHALTIAEL